MNALQLRDNAKQQLAEIKTIESGVEYLNKVKAIEVWAKAEKKDAELQNIVAEQKLRTQRILGGLLKEANLNKGGNPNLSTDSTGLKVSDVGITRNESSTFQKINWFQENYPKEFEQTILKEKELTTAKMLQAAKQHKLDKIRTDESNKIKTVNINENTINGDSLEVLKTLDDGCIDIVITDPPYGINYKSNGSKYTNSITNRGLLNDGHEAFKLLDDTCKILLDKTAEKSHLYFFCSWAVFSEFESIIEKYFIIKTPLVWDKLQNSMGDLTNSWGNQTEIIIHCVKGHKGLNKRKGNLIKIPRLHSSKMVHPTQKPVELIKELLEVSALKNDFVVDPFMGSGSTIKACNEYGVKSLGIELDKEMFLIANKNIND
jgi:DNA modification methylase